MLKQKRIHVTLDEIEEGKPYDADHCPIALALQSAYPTLDFEVGTEAVSVFFPHSLLIDEYQLPPHITKWINAYDHRQAVHPFVFDFPFKETPCPRSPNP